MKPVIIIPPIAIVELPEGAHSIVEFSPGNFSYEYGDNEVGEILSLPGFRFTPIGWLDKLSEEQAGELVVPMNQYDTSSGKTVFVKTIGYQDYDPEAKPFEYLTTATASLKSLIESNGWHCVNPYGETPETFYGSKLKTSQRKLDKWQSAEEKTLKNSFILKIEKI